MKVLAQLSLPQQLTSTVATGTAPLTVASTTLVANLNADLLDGLSSSAFALTNHGNHVPTLQVANNSVFLRNDNTWATITPANIGAQAANTDLTAIAGLAGTSGFLKKTAAGSWSLDTNAYLTANQSITVSGDATGSGTTAITLTLANSGVTAGTYTKLTVDAKGRVTSGAGMASSDVTTALGYTPLSTSGTAAAASKVYNDANNMTFHWNGQNGTPNWVWGNDGTQSTDMYVYNPANFNVNSANYLGGYGYGTAGTANMIVQRNGSGGINYLGKTSACSWNGSLASGSSVTITHNLGYNPIVCIGLNGAGAGGNYELTFQYVNYNQISVGNWNSGSNTAPVYVYMW